MSIEIEFLKREIFRLKNARKKDALDHEQAMRILIKVFAKRGEVIANLRERADNWQANAVRMAVRNVSLGRKLKVLESCIRKDRHDNRRDNALGIFRRGANRVA